MSAAVAPASFSNSAFGRIAVLKVASAGRIDGSGCFNVTVIVSPAAVTLSIDSTSEAHGPESGSVARSSDQVTSSAVRGEPSENLTPERNVSVTVLPSSDTLHFVARPGLRPSPSSVGSINVS